MIGLSLSFREQDGVFLIRPSRIDPVPGDDQPSLDQRESHVEQLVPVLPRLLCCLDVEVGKEVKDSSCRERAEHPAHSFLAVLSVMGSSLRIERLPAWE